MEVEDALLDLGPGGHQGLYSVVSGGSRVGGKDGQASRGAGTEECQAKRWRRPSKLGPGEGVKKGRRLEMGVGPGSRVFCVLRM